MAEMGYSLERRAPEDVPLELFCVSEHGFTEWFPGQRWSGCGYYGAYQDLMAGQRWTVVGWREADGPLDRQSAIDVADPNNWRWTQYLMPAGRIVDNQSGRFFKPKAPPA